MRKALVFGAVIFLLLEGVSYAIVAPFQTALLTPPALPASASSYRKSPQEIMQPIQQDINPLDTQDAVPYDDGITWSWEEKVTPLDILEYVKDLPYNEWIEIDEKTTRQLFESVVQKALQQMQIEGNGGEFEKVLRQKLLYFTPEYEYYYPPYEEDFSKRVVRFPVKIRKEHGFPHGSDIVVFHLGRAYDDEREISFFLDTLNNGNQILGGIGLDKDRYVPGETGPPKKESLFLVWKNPGFQEVDLNKRYYNNDGTMFGDKEQLLVFHQGNPAPVEDNTASEPPLEISGVECLFDLKYGDYERWNKHAFQTFRGLVNLCKLQLNLQDNGHELEKILWRDFFIYKPDWNTDLGETALDLEIAGVERLNPPDENTELFKFNILTAQVLRHIYVTLTKDLGKYIGYEWGVKHIRLVFSTADSNGNVTGQEDRNFEFAYTMDYTEGINPAEIAAYYDRYLFDTNGMLLTTPEEELIAAFYYNQPRPYVLSMRNK